MGQAAPSSAPKFAAANAGVQSAANNANALNALSPPKTYNPNLADINSTAGMLAKAQTLNNNQALAQVNPQALTGKNQAITDLTGGVAGDNQFLRDAALKAGLEKSIGQGTTGAGSITSPTSAGGVTAQKIFGSDLLNYRNSRDQQAFGVAGAIQPDASLSPQSGVGLKVASDEQQIQNKNDWNQYLANMRLGSVSNLQNLVQQEEGASQSAANAATDSQNAKTTGAVGAAATIAAATAVIL